MVFYKMALFSPIPIMYTRGQIVFEWNHCFSNWFAIPRIDYVTYIRPKTRWGEISNTTNVEVQVECHFICRHNSTVLKFTVNIMRCKAYLKGIKCCFQILEFIIIFAPSQL